MAEHDNDVREFWRLLEPIHAVVYFSPEPLAALREAGYRGFWMGYFANRAAPLGPVGPEVVHALFYNFGWARVTRALPTAWQFAPPPAALRARVDGSVAALRRALGDPNDGPDVARAAELAMRAAVAAPLEGRTLFAANHALPVPDEPLEQLWHAATLLREHRGDGHVAALLASGITGREAHVFHAVAVGTPSEVYTLARDFTEEEWDGELSALRDRGLVEGDALTEQGQDLHAQIEDTTDRLAAPAYDVLTAAERAELLELLRPLAAAVARTGDIPLDSPMGLDLRDYDPESMTDEQELPEHAARNREHWDELAAGYVSAGERQWGSPEATWGIWNIPESELHLLDGVEGLDAIELGCGTAYVSAWLVRRGARPVGIDNSPKQLETAERLQREHGLEFPLLLGNAEHVPYPDGSFDFAISEYGACLWADPHVWVAEAARLLRPGGRLVFLTNGYLLMLCAPDAEEDPATDRMLRSSFGMHRFEWPDDPSVEFHLAHGDWIRVLRENGFEVEDLIELQAPEDATSNASFVSPEWAQRWPSEEVWVARKRG